MGEFPDSSTPSPATNQRPAPAREDCWSEEATFTLIEAWGQRYVELNRGNLRQKQWQEVADTVNARHGHIKKARRTDVQCKNRIDTLKKKYKVEKARVLESGGVYKSSWPFFAPLDSLIGSTLPLKKMSPSPIAPSPSPQPTATPAPPMAVPLLPMKRPSPAVASTTPFRGEESSSYFRKNYSAIAAAAAAAESEEEDEEEEEEEEEVEVSGGGSSEAEGIRKLAKVIEKFGEVYARVEAEKQRQMIELEKQRMQFAKELECQRMQMMVEMQVQLEKIKRAKRSDSNDMYS